MELAPEGFARRRRRGRPDQRVEHPLFRRQLGLGLDVLALARLCQRNGDLDEIADDLLDVAPDIADLGELGRLDLEERRAGKFRRARRAISVLPQPVGPIIRMFFGITSSRIGEPSRSRRQRLRKAMATALFASAWPTM